MQFAVYISETSATLKPSQCHQTYNDNVDPKQGCNYAKFERSYFNDIAENANIRKYISFLPCTCARAHTHSHKWYLYDIPDVINNCTSFNLIG